MKYFVWLKKILLTPFSLNVRVLWGLVSATSPTVPPRMLELAARNIEIPNAC